MVETCIEIVGMCRKKTRKFVRRFLSVPTLTIEFEQRPGQQNGARPCIRVAFEALDRFVRSPLKVENARLERQAAFVARGALQNALGQFVRDFGPAPLQLREALDEHCIRLVRLQRENPVGGFLGDLVSAEPERELRYRLEGHRIARVERQGIRKRVVGFCRCVRAKGKLALQQIQRGNIIAFGNRFGDCAAGGYQVAGVRKGLGLASQIGRSLFAARTGRAQDCKTDQQVRDAARHERVVNRLAIFRGQGIVRAETELRKPAMKIPRWLTAIAIGWLAMALEPIAALAQPVPTPGGQAVVVPQAVASARPAVQASPYRINAGDELNIYVWGEDRLQRDIRVLPDGTFAFPLIGQVVAQGRLPAEIQATITERLRDQYRGEVPQVTVSVKQPLGLQFSVLGRVKSPGTFSPGRYVNLLEALSMAGGPTEFANLDSVLILRKRGDQLQSIRARVAPLFKSGADLGDVERSNISRVETGDTIIVP